MKENLLDITCYIASHYQHENNKKMNQEEKSMQKVNKTIVAIIKNFHYNDIKVLNSPGLEYYWKINKKFGFNKVESIASIIMGELL